MTGPSADKVCATVVIEEAVNVNFTLETAGEYILNFFLNGIFAETRNITVSK
ncbi:MAG: hypothetical protein O2U61_04260 [Candidatus Bathyarchaeota archaeon]|nr:hypothetical protein [Candidatus Bathyarchaeota archaeon]